MTLDQYKELLIKRIIEERKELADLQYKVFVEKQSIFQECCDEQFGYVAGLMYALTLLERKEPKII